MMARGARILLGRNVLDGLFKPLKSFIKFPFAVDGRKGYAQEVMLARLADRESAGMHYSYASLAEEVLSFRT